MILDVYKPHPNIYGFMLLGGILAGLVHICICLLRCRIQKWIVSCCLCLDTVCVIYFAALWSAVSGWKEGKGLFRSGFTSMGGAVGLLVSVMVLSCIFKGLRHMLMTAHTTALPLMYAVSKTGCFFAGCCHGREAQFLAVRYPGSDASYIPVQLYETIAFLAVYLILFRMKNKNTAALILSCSAKFFLDFLREPVSDSLVSVNQTACIIMMVLMCFILKKYFSDNTKTGHDNV